MDCYICKRNDIDTYGNKIEGRRVCYDCFEKHGVNFMPRTFTEKLDIPVKLPDGEYFDRGDWETYSEEYSKKPVVIRALRLEIPVTIETLEGTMTGEVGDYLIRGLAGEFYPCKPDIFKQSYKKV